ncbi:hypothetical protein [Bacillus pumilus]|uniref:hypothetical protein n=1 Tax=Bacillus pumilus TaxID=1408 RepID=UPI002417BFAA|nr:hypothetical protein [Bacillus pumilus]WFO49272.1 hypothetical protein MK860_08970 [Bacillus pumilus]
MKKSIENFLKKLRKKPKSLFITCTLIPIGVSIIGVELEWLGNEYFSNFILLLSSSYTIVSLILVFLLLKQYSHPDFVMEKTSLEYLNNEALSELIESLDNLQNLFQSENEIKGNDRMMNSCYSKLKEIYDLLSLLDDTADPTILSPYQSDIKKIINFINSNKIRSKGTQELPATKRSDVEYYIYYALGRLTRLEKERQKNEQKL